MKTKRNANNREYMAIMKLINEWQEKHPGQKYPRGWGNKLRKIAQRYASRPKGEEE